MPLEFKFDDGGKRKLAELCRAAGHDAIENTDELHGIPLMVALDANDDIVGFGAGDEWEVERAKRMERDRRRDEWDAAHPELFVDNVSADATNDEE